jgi:hypothetical protein
MGVATDLATPNTLYLVEATKIMATYSTSPGNDALKKLFSHKIFVAIEGELLWKDLLFCNRRTD